MENGCRQPEAGGGKGAACCEPDEDRADGHFHAGEHRRRQHAGRQDDASLKEPRDQPDILAMHWVQLFQ